MREPLPAEIDAAGEALRARMMQGPLTLPWTGLKRVQKRKWLEHAESALRAAFNAYGNNERRYADET